MSAAFDADAADASGNQTMQAQWRLRDLILSGELPPGARIAEVALAERLGVSRTPVRAALLRLEQEGLLEPIAERGYRVRAFSQQDVEDAIELRGTLEGLAGRLAAERGVPRAQLDEARALLREIDRVLAGPEFGAPALERYVRANEAFHALLARMAGSAVVLRQIERAIGLPFASPSAFLQVQAATPGARDNLLIAQDQHQQALEAIERREGARAEALLREHARIARRNLLHALAHQPAMQLVPGASLIRMP